MSDSNPLVLFNTLQETLRRYIPTTLPVSRRYPSLQGAFEDLLHKQPLVKGPYVEALPDFEKGATLESLLDNGILHEGLRSLPGEWVHRPLHKHQEKAIKLACQEDRQNLMVATGTGSGKTEAFLLPIFSALAKEALTWPAASGELTAKWWADDKASDPVSAFRLHRVDEATVHGEPADEALQTAMDPFGQDVLDGLELLEGAGADLDPALVAKGGQTPMFFGSALTNFGVHPFLETFLKMAPMPLPRESGGEKIDPVSHPFSGFVFKIQANMDPDHRDRVAFVRICSGHFEKGRQTQHVRTGKTIRLTNSTLLMGKDRVEAEEAFAGDVVGLFDPGIFRIGDTLCDGGDLAYSGIPIFAPESYMRVEVAGVQKRKALEKGIEQLVQEGVVQLFQDPEGGSASWILGAMGPLQFDVMQHRLKSEYGVDLTLSPLPYKLARWPQAGFDPADFRYSERVRAVQDRDGRWALLGHSIWDFDRLTERNEALELAETPDPSLFEGAD